MEQNQEQKIFHLVQVMMKKVRKDNEIKQERKKVMASLIRMIILMIKQMTRKMMPQGQDHQEIQAKINIEIKDLDLDLTGKEIKITIRMKEADIIMMAMIEIKKVIIIAMKNMTIMITTVTEIEIIEEIKIEETKIPGHLRESGFHLSTNQCSQKKSLKAIKIPGLIGLKYKRPIMIM